MGQSLDQELTFLRPAHREQSQALSPESHNHTGKSRRGVSRGPRPGFCSRLPCPHRSRPLPACAPAPARRARAFPGCRAAQLSPLKSPSLTPTVLAVDAPSLLPFLAQLTKLSASLPPTPQPTPIWLSAPSPFQLARGPTASLSRATGMPPSLPSSRPCPAEGTTRRPSTSDTRATPSPQPPPSPSDLRDPSLRLCLTPPALHLLLHRPLGLFKNTYY